MNGIARVPIARHWVAILACLSLDGAAAAEPAVATQDLTRISALPQVATARWSRLADSWNLQVVLDASWREERRKRDVALTRAEANRHSSSISAEDKERLAHTNIETQLAVLQPRFDGIPVPAPSGEFLAQPFPPRIKERRLDVWLLNADGTVILPSTYGWRTEAGEVTYDFPAAAGAKAVAVALRIEDDFYVEALPQLEAKAAAR